MAENNIDREGLHKALDKFLDELAKEQPSADAGESHVLSIEGMREAWADDDTALFTFSVTTTKTGMF